MGEGQSRITQLIVVRHGVPDEGNIDQPGDPPLNNAGRLQASRLAERLRNEGVSRIVSSPQRRALETAQPLSERLGLPVEVLDGLAEVDRHTNRYRSPEAIRHEEPRRWQEFLASPIAYFGIDEYEFNSAVLGAFAGLFGCEVRTVAVFSHGTPIRVILQHALRLKSRPNHRIGHCSVTRIVGKSFGELTVECIGDDLVSAP